MILFSENSSGSGLIYIRPWCLNQHFSRNRRGGQFKFCTGKEAAGS